MIDRVQNGSVYSTKQRSNEIDKNNLVEEDLISEKVIPVEDIIQIETKEKGQVEEIVKGLNDFLTPTHTSLKFVFHEKLNEYYVTLVDDQTQQVVREIPSKKMLDFYAAMTDFIGILVDKKI